VASASRSALLAAALLVLGGGCGSSVAPRAASPTPTDKPVVSKPALCSSLRARVMGRVDAPGATELSGLALSPSGSLWTMNDSGGAPAVLELARDARLLRTVTLEGAQNVDWEDIASRGRTLYVGDIGDNATARAEVVVYRFTEPTGTSVVPSQIVLRYPDGPHDAEALLVDPRSGLLVIVTKDFGGVAGVYTARRSGVLHKAGTVSLGVGEAVTAGDAVEGFVVLRTYDRAFVFRGASVVSALRRSPCVAGANLIREGQGEALALERSGRAFWTVPEGTGVPLRRYSVR
jgi:hypothetical protein